MNTFKSTLLLVLLTVFLILIGDRFGGRNGMVGVEDVQRAAGDSGAVAAGV
jgi:hypothetical protein